jgi:hypothetical protein
VTETADGEEALQRVASPGEPPKQLVVADAARLVVGRDHEAQQCRMRERMESYLKMVDKHVDEHTADLLFNNLPKIYRRFVEQAIERSRNGHRVTWTGSDQPAGG